MNNTQPALHSYAEKSRSIRMARALLDEGYDQAHVIKALTDKGYNLPDALEIIHAGRLAHCDQKIGQTRTVAVVLGIGWMIILALYFFTSDNPASTSLIDRQPVVPGKMVGYGAAISLSAFSTWIFYWNKKRKLLKASRTAS